MNLIEHPSARTLSPKQAQCTCCGALFNTDRIFERHRVGSYAMPGQWRGARRCLTSAEMQAKGWRRNAHGFWLGKAGDPARFSSPGKQPVAGRVK